MQQVSGRKRIKVIDIDDKFIDHRYHYPYFQCINSKVRFFLRSKLTYNHLPFILIEKDNHFDTLLPLQSSILLEQQWTQDNFRVIKGRFTNDGAWVADLKCDHPGLINFQVVFEPLKGPKAITKMGACDTIIVMQDKIDIRFLRKMTVFPRCIGHHTKWVYFFKKQIQLGYNSFHLAPIQQTGSSKSYYSIFNHLELSNDFFDGATKLKIDQLKTIVKEVNDMGGIFFIDIVINHASFDSLWIKNQPNSVYTIHNTPHLTSAFEVDNVIYHWGKEIKQVMAPLNIQMGQQQFKSHHQKLQSLILQMNLLEYFQLEKGIISEMMAKVPPSKPSQNLFAKDPCDIIEQFINVNACGFGCSRLGIKVANLDTSWKQLNLGYQLPDLEKAVDKYNKKWQNKIVEEWVPEIIKNVMDEVKRNYIDNKRRCYGDHDLFVKKYFTKIHNENGNSFYAVNNGWVSGADTAEAHFIYSKQFFYFRRRVNVWGDLVRLRYGEKPTDVPYTWKYIENYISLMAEIFDGFRMDNLHGTQLHVAKYMVRKARQVNPNLIVFAQLFTETEEEKAMYVRSVGINSTLVEGQWLTNGNSFVKNFNQMMGESGPYIGSITPYFEKEGVQMKHSRRKQPLRLIYDLTHDNNTYHQKGMLIKQLPITLLISLMGTFIGSTKGYDQFYSKKIIVNQQSPIYSQDKQHNPLIDASNIMKKRIILNKKTGEVYGSWNQWKEPLKLTYDQDSQKCWGQIELPSGLYQYKFKSEENWINDNNYFINNNSNHEFYLPNSIVKTIYPNLQGFRKQCANYAKQFEQFRQYSIYNDEDIVVIIRQTKNHQQSICIIANLSKKEQSIKKQIMLPGRYHGCEVWHQTDYAANNGLQIEVEIVHHQNIYEFFQINNKGPVHNDILIGTTLPPGFGCIIKCKKDKAILELIDSAAQILNQPIRLPPLGALDINLILFGIARQQEIRFGQSNYVIPGSKQLVYGGFGGIYKMICQAKKYNKLSLPLYNNLREGNWLMKYYVDRIKRYKCLSEVADIIERYFSIIQQLPRQLIPTYFTDFVYKLWKTIKSQFVAVNPFQAKLLLASSQFISNFPHQKPMFQTSVAAGLPHFAIGWARCWGRDTFICNEMLLNHPNIYREVILQFASALRHGTIPNLLDNGNNPRYNSRDSCWWFIRGVKEYAKKTGDYDIFKNKVNMMFLSNDLVEHHQRQSRGETKVMILEDIIHEIFQSHADGIFYRQWNAGIQIDSNMSSEGFTIQLQVDENTGFIVGGNTLNCLTWMDKMGQSLKAGSKGFPSTPRCGSPIELVGLLKNCLTAYSNLYDEGKYSYKSVMFKHREVPLSDWANRIQEMFQLEYYIPENNDSYKTNKKGVNYKIGGIYKDTVFSQIQPEEGRLRPNALIALALAPEIFQTDHALSYLSKVRKYLIQESSIGISTLAPFHESLFCSIYDNDDDSDMAKISHGYSYHNGPQWVWLYGFYVMAVINFKPQRINRSRAMGLLQNHIKYITSDEWCSLPELTNSNGIMNNFSCNARAWSISSMLLAIQEIQNLPK